MDSARALIARGWGVSLVSRCLRVSRAQLHVILRRTDDWKDGRRSRHSDDTDVLLRIHHVIGELPTYGYGTDKVLNDVSLSLPTGKITALIGPNGCGKSTLLNCFSRLLMPQSGTVFLGDNPINMLSSRQLARRLSLLPQHHLTPEGITVQELVSYGRNPWLSLWGRLSAEDNARVNVAMNQTRINHLAVRRLTELSGGQRQRVFLAMVLAQNTPVVLLDEPTTYLDINHQVDLMRLMGELRTQGKTVVAVLHDLNQASRYCDQLVVMANGHVMAQGTPEEVMTPGLLRTVFSVEAEIHPEPVSGRPMCLMR